MAKHVITVEGISKRYRLGRKLQNSTTFREATLAALAAPFRRFRDLREGSDNQRAGPEAFWALKDVSFTVGKGEVIGLIGRNGAGKSTLLKVLSRIVEPTSGTVRMRGRVASLLEVGTGFHPELSGRENIFLNGAILGMKRAEILKNFDAIVDFAEVEKFLDTPVKFYSSGMYVRLAFAVAAHLEPEILIVDEVLAVGDAAFQKKCMGRMGNVAREGRTILFVSHNMAAVRSLCSRVIWIDAGRTHDDGAPEKVTSAFLQHMLSDDLSGQDLAEKPRSDGLGDQMRVQRYEFNYGKPVVHGEPLHCRLEFLALKDVEDAAVGFGLNSLDSTRIMSFDSDLNGERYNVRAGQHCAVEFDLPRLDIEPGTYILHVGARSGIRKMLDNIVDGLWVEVLAGPQTPSFIIGQRAGLRVNSACNWEITDRARAPSKQEVF